MLQQILKVQLAECRAALTRSHFGFHKDPRFFPGRQDLAPALRGFVRTYPIESFYIVLHHPAEIDWAGRADAFILTVRENRVARAASANPAVTSALHRRHFGFRPENLARLIEVFPAVRKEARFSCGPLVQAAHMLNPLFLADVV